MAPDASTRFSLLCRHSLFCQYFLALLVIVTPSLFADEQALISDPIELPFSHDFNNQLIKTGSELQLRGNNTTESALIMVIRIDDEASETYRSRFNREFSIQPGSFSINIPITGLKTSGKQPMKQPYSEMIIFISGSARGVVLNSAQIKQPSPPPKEILALDFSLKNSPLFPGFKRLTPKDPILSGTIRPRYRPSGNSLVRDGFEGIERVTVPWRNGYWKLSLWVHEQGEWEYLPHSLERKIIAENQVMVDHSWEVDEWIDEVYLAGKKREAIIDGDLWELVGKRRSGLIQKIVHITDEQLDIILTGNKKSAQYLSGLVLEPVGHPFSSATEKEVKSRFLAHWPVSSPSYTPPKTLTLTDISKQPKSGDLKRYLAAQGSLLNLKFQIQSPDIDYNPLVATAPPRSRKGAKLNLKKRYGHWRYERPMPNASSLIVSDSLLRGDFENMRLSPKMPRNIYLQVAIPDDAEPGLYSGSIQLFSQASLQVINYQIEVLPVQLPPLEKSVGLYLTPPPFYQWFGSLHDKASLSTECDLNLLQSFGFNTVAPSLDTPVSHELRLSFIEQLKRLQQAGFNQPVMAYTPLKRLLVAAPDGHFEHALIELKALLDEEKQLPPIYWSIYDEPAQGKFNEIKRVAQRLHEPLLMMKTAGHLNHPRQGSLLESTDLAIMNHGFGVRQGRVSALQKNKKVWLYNMPDPRLAAGYYLWKVGADGYLQWHGRMPTADPFDPTDGREGDVIYIYPSSQQCPAIADIHSRLLDLHEATLDLRWLQWLDQQAASNSAAKSLRNYLLEQISGNWAEAEQSVSREQLLQVRQAIIDFSLSRVP